MNDLTLYADAQLASPYAMSVFVGLHEKRLAFDLKKLDLAAGQHRASDYRLASLTQRVPTLVHGDFSLSESSAITEYLDEAFPGTTLYPETTQSRARARQLQAWLRSDLMPLRMERPTSVLFYGYKGPALSSAAAAASEKLFALASTLLGTKAFLFGGWSIADLDLALMLNRLVMHGDAVPSPLAEYARRQFERPSVARWLALERLPV